MRKILIIGANYRNKGAQSMLYITVDEIRKRIPDCEIYFGGTWTEPKLEDVNFKQICCAREIRNVILGNEEKIKNWILAIGKALIVTFRKGHTNIFNFLDLKNEIRTFDLIIDVSGYALGDKWSKTINDGFLNVIRIAQKYDIPIYLMPQSFGPFEYSNELQYLNKDIKELLKYPKMIFAREQEGYNYLVEDFGLNNVMLSKDLVLQNKGIDYSNVFLKKPTLSLPEIKTKNNVGIVTNEKCFTSENEMRLLEIYRVLIEELLNQGKEVYLFRHSKEDISVLLKIANLYNNEHVHLLQNDFSCLEYDEFVKNFDFLICSRFHGIVHAYRNNIPVIALGWAIKYRELTKAVEQKEFVFDISRNNCNVNEIIQAMKILSTRLQQEKKLISKNMQSIQEENCFDHIEDLFVYDKV